MYQSNIYEYLENLTDNQLLICKNDKEAIQVRDVAVLLKFDTFVLPDIRVSVGEDLRSYGEDLQEFFTQLSLYWESNSKKVLISPIRTVLIPFPKPELFSTKTIEFGDTLNLKELKDKLYYWGYHFSDITASRGEVSFRGDIIDIFPINASKPYRISLFDNDVEAIQTYDEGSQKRHSDELESLIIPPAFLALNKEEHTALKNRCERSSYDTFVKDIDSLGLWHLGEELSRNAFELFDVVLASPLSDELEEIYELSTPLVNIDAFNLTQIKEGTRYRDL